ncbi:hypothetical protein ACOSQ2_004462 [Xanthoceras sorbifolium]
MSSSMNPWNDDSSLTEALLLMRSDLSGLPTPSSQASSLTADGYQPTKTLMPSSQPFYIEDIQPRLQRLIEDFRESWTYAVFWQLDSGTPVLGWGDGYYKGADEDDVCKEMYNGFSSTEQEHRKSVLRELNRLISGSMATPEEFVEEEFVTDSEWFFLVSMTASFLANCGGLPSLAFDSNSLVWVCGPDRLVTSGCERARQGNGFGIQTMVYIPLPNYGVVELGSTQLIISEKWDVMNKVQFLFNFDGTRIRSWPQNQASEAFNCMFDLIKKVNVENLKLRKLERKVTEKERALAEAETKLVEMEQNLLRESMNKEQLMQQLLAAQNEVGIFRRTVEMESCQKEKAEEALVKLNEVHSKLAEDLMKKFAAEAKMWAAHAYRYGYNQALNANDSNRIYTPDQYDISLGFQPGFSQLSSSPPPPFAFAVAGDQRHDQQRVGLLHYLFDYLKLAR